MGPGILPDRLHGALTRMSRLKKTITITILPGMTEKTKQWTIPRWALYLFLVLVFLTISGGISLIIFYSYETKRFMALKNIQEETRLQKEHLEHYRKELESIEAQLSEVNNLDSQIMNMVAKGAPDVRSGPAEKNNLPLPESSAGAVKPSSAPKPEALPWSYDASDRRFSVPVQGWITSSFGVRKGPMGTGEEFHPGLDIAQEVGVNIRSPAQGVVILIDRTPDYGNYVIIYHGLGVSSLFAHLDQINVEEGQSVAKDAQIGTVGLTGLTTAPHLHYELREFGHPVDPGILFGNRSGDPSRQ